MTPEEQMQQAIFALRFDIYAAKRLKVLTPRGQFVPFTLFPEQVYFHNLLQLRRKQGKPGLWRICKARKRGMSTLSVGDLFHQIQYGDHIVWGVIYGHESEASSNLFNIFDTFSQSIPEWERKEILKDTQKEINYKEGHIVRVNTVGSKGESRSGSPNYLICTEVAKYAEKTDVVDHMAGIKSGIQVHERTTIIEESTSFGLDDYWYANAKRTQDVIATISKKHGIHSTKEEELRGETLQYKLLHANLWPEDEYAMIFIPWFWNSENVREVTEDLIETLTDYEMEIMERFNLSLERIAWRRFVKKANCGDDEEMTRQEYPCDVEESFRKSGNPVFNSEKLLSIRHRVEVLPRATKEQLETNSFNPENTLVPYNLVFKKAPEEVDPSFFKGVWDIEVEAHPDPRGTWIEFIPPIPEYKYRYCMGVDSAQGLEQGDYSSIVVFDRLHKKFVAYGMEKWGMRDLADMVTKAAVRYNYADVLAEKNETGHGVLMRLVPMYPNVLRQHKMTTGFDEGIDAANYGIRTDKYTKPLLVENFENYFKGISEDSNSIPFIELLTQMDTFVRDARGLAGASGKRTNPGSRNFDDLVIAAALALEADRILTIDGLTPEAKVKEKVTGPKRVVKVVRKSRGL